MPLPILHPRFERSDKDLIRLFHQTESRWCEHMAVANPLDVGTAYTNPKLPNVYDANHLTDVALPEGITPSDAYALVADHFREQGTRCAYWSLNPSAPEPTTRPMAEHLLSLGYRALSVSLMCLERIPPVQVPVVADLKIIPTRASYRHAKLLFQESASAFGEEQVVEAELSHLDDPHWDSLLALKNGEPVATAGVLAVGEVGRIDQVYVARAHRRQGFGLLMIARVLETCARSLFKHVLLTCSTENAGALALYRRFGFRTVGPVTGYFAPGIDPKPKAE